MIVKIYDIWWTCFKEIIDNINLVFKLFNATRFKKDDSQVSYTSLYSLLSRQFLQLFRIKILCHFGNTSCCSTSLTNPASI